MAWPQHGSGQNSLEPAALSKGTSMDLAWWVVDLQTNAPAGLVRRDDGPTGVARPGTRWVLKFGPPLPL